MNVGGGEAADQMVRMMLTGTEVTIKLGGSLLKNVLALTMALAKNHKTLSGKINLGRMLKETRDLRQFTMTSEQYQDFKKRAVKQKILFSTIREKDGRGKFVQVIVPSTELDRVNQLFERILYTPPQERQAPQQEERQAPQPEKERQEPKKGFRSGRDSHDTKTKSSAPRSGETERTTSDRPSVEGKLKVYREQLQNQKKSAPARAKTKSRPKTK